VRDGAIPSPATAAAQSAKLASKLSPLIGIWKTTNHSETGAFSNGVKFTATVTARLSIQRLADAFVGVLNVGKVYTRTERKTSFSRSATIKFDFQDVNEWSGLVTRITHAEMSVTNDAGTSPENFALRSVTVFRHGTGSMSVSLDFDSGPWSRERYPLWPE
jgi:hypothetical protein